MAGIGAAVLGWMADHYSIETVYHVCAFLPILGLLTYFLPNLDRPGARKSPDAHVATPELDA
jgi:FSR family fosmidomycin resistance protein-like MFS transporter